MNRIEDRKTQAQALWLLRTSNLLKRWRLHLMVAATCTLVGATIVPQFKMRDDQRVNAIEWKMANTMLWLADGSAISPNINVTIGDRKLVVPAALVARDGRFLIANREFNRLAFGGGLLGLAFGIFGCALLLTTMRIEADDTFGDRILGGTRIVSAQRLMQLLSGRVEPSAVRLGPISIPTGLETRHFLITGTTGSGKTTALRQLLDAIEARGDMAIIFDSSREFIANYYDPDRNDTILDPFDARCPIWSPFSEIAHPADCDRIAHQLVSETGERDDDVWLQTSRILVANMLRQLWADGRHDLVAFLEALQVKSKDELKTWLGQTSSARTFADDADRASGSVLFMLSKAANLVQFLRIAGNDAQPFAFRDSIGRLDNGTAPKPWIFVPRREQYFEAAKPLIAAWLECAASAILSLPPSPKRRIWLILDELADLPKVENLARLLPEGRKFGASVAITFQALGQMRARYGDRIAEAMLGCCNTKLFLQLTDQETRHWASETCGDCEIELRSATDNLTLDKDKARTSVSTVRQIRPAIMESEFRLPAHEGFLLLPDGYPVARIRLTNAHIVRRGLPREPAFVEGKIEDTLWSQLTSIAPVDPKGPV